MMRLDPAHFVSLAVMALSIHIAPLAAQDVISARSGTVHFIEGAVSIDNQPLDRKSGAFPVVKEGSTVETARGRAEILLTPGAFLRLDENTAVKMTTTKLSDTQVDFLSGSIIADLNSPASTAVRITDRDAQIEFPKTGVYRIDADTGVLQVYSGEALVTSNGRKAKVDTSHLFFFSLGLETNKLGPTEDEFYDWARDRNQTISDENQLAEQTKGDPGDFDPGAGAYLGNPNLGTNGSIAPLPTIPSPLGPSVPYPSLPSYGAYGAFDAYGYSQYLNPSFAFAPAPYLLTGFPQILVVPYRPRLHNNPNWPHTTTPVWHSVSTGALPTLPRLTMVPSRSAIAPLGAYRPVASPHLGRAVAPQPVIAAPHPVLHR